VKITYGGSIGSGSVAGLWVVRSKSTGQQHGTRWVIRINVRVTVDLSLRGVKTTELFFFFLVFG
jgi:hypothetical protein